MSIFKKTAAFAPQTCGVLLAAAAAGDEAIRVRQWLTELGLANDVRISMCGLQLHIACARGGHNTLDLQRDWLQTHGSTLTLEQETVLAMLRAPITLECHNLAAWQSHVRVRLHTAHAARRTALAFATEAAERPLDFWHYDDTHGFLLNEGCDLVEAIVAATQPGQSGKVYDFSCYRATEYLLLLGIARELKAHNPRLYDDLQALCRIHAIRSGQFHNVFLTEYGSMQAPIEAHHYIPGDRVWFRNPDPESSDIDGYEGSWVIYMGGGQFSNFWAHDLPYTLQRKCIEIFHWRDGLVSGAQGQMHMDESRVAAAMQVTLQSEQATQAVLNKMMRWRDVQGVYADGGCIDTTRECARHVGPAHCQLVLPTPSSFSN